MGGDWNGKGMEHSGWEGNGTLRMGGKWDLHDERGIEPSGWEENGTLRMGGEWDTQDGRRMGPSGWEENGTGRCQQMVLQIKLCYTNY